MNVSLSSRHSVHAAHEGGNTPKCHTFGAPHGAEAYRATTREVTCKKCIKVLATEAEAEAAYQDRLAASMMPSSDFHATPEAADQPAEIVAIREEAEHAADVARVDAAILRLATKLDTPAAGRSGRTVSQKPAAGRPLPKLDAPVVAELNGRPAVWMVQKQGRTLWAAKDAQGLYTSKARATAAQQRAESLAAMRAREAARPRRSYVSLRRLLDLNG
jgi:hypothetical protein